MENNNIPSIATGEAVEILTMLYKNAYKDNILDTLPSVCLWGPMGAGKSESVMEIAENLRNNLGIRVGVTDVRLLNFSPVDLRGIPAADANKEFSVWLMPKIFDLPDDDGINIFFLDEISAAPQSLQAAAYQIALDKKIGEHELPNNTLVILAGNRLTDKSVAFRMPKALANRLMHFEIKPTFDSFYIWAVNHDIDSRVIGYLAFDNSKLNVEPDMEELAFPTPRSWEFVSRLLKMTKKTPGEIHELISGLIGVSSAVEFEAFCRSASKLPKIADIINGTCRMKAKEADVLYALISSLITAVSNKRGELTETQIENVCAYVSEMPSDFATMFFRGIINIPGLNARLMLSPSFNQWMKKNKRFL